MTAEACGYADFIKDFEATIEESSRKLAQLNPSTEPAPDRWNANEILGHLIDSAANNHTRFVRAQFTPDLTFPGYEQDGWVKVQDYRSEPWQRLVQLWTLYNLHLVRFVSRIPPEQLTISRQDHNLDRIAWKPVPRNQAVTLEYFIRDYVDHLKHHLTQILGMESRSKTAN
jgi:hypothetical protein